MKKIVLLLFLFSCTVGFSQSEKADVQLFYYTAIKNHIDYFRAMFEKVGSVYTVSALYFVAENVSSEYLPKQIEGDKINDINIYHKKNRKLLKEGVSTLSIQPIQLNGNQVEIDLKDYKETWRFKVHFLNRRNKILGIPKRYTYADTIHETEENEEPLLRLR